MAMDTATEDRVPVIQPGEPQELLGELLGACRDLPTDDGEATPTCTRLMNIVIILVIQQLHNVHCVF